MTHIDADYILRNPEQLSPLVDTCRSIEDMENLLESALDAFNQMSHRLLSVIDVELEKMRKLKVKLEVERLTEYTAGGK